MVDKSAISSALADILKDYDIEKAYIYGSYARGDATADSDIDMRFLCGKQVNFAQLHDIQRQLEKRLETKVDIATAPPNQMRKSFYNRIKQEEVLLYGS